LEDVGHGGGEMAGVEEVVVDMTEVVVDMTGVVDMENDIRKERRALLQRRLHEVKSGRDKGDYTMKKLLFGTILLALVLVFPIPTMARVDVGISISLPPLIVFAAPPMLIVLPETYVYAVPDVDADIFFYNGWWWRLWEGRWYRSHYYNRGWGYYNKVPSFYFDVDPGWRGYYRDRNWYGHRWNYQRIPHQQVQRNWRSWVKSRHWEKQQTWGVQSYQARPQQQRQELRQQRQQQYQQRPEVQQHQKQRQQQQRQPKVQKPQSQQQKQPQERVQQPQRQEQRPQVKQPQHREAGPQSREGKPVHSQEHQGTHERGNVEKQDRR
jgi:hypothetical protein